MARRVTDGRRPVAEWLRRNRLAVVALCVTVYAAALQLGYMTIITHSYAYLGYRSRTPNLLALLLSLGSAIAVTAVMPRRLTRPSHLVLWVMLLLGVLPAVLVPPYADILPIGQSVQLILIVAAVFALVVLVVRRLPAAVIPLVPLPQRVVLGAIALFCLVVYGYMFFTVGLRVQMISLLNVTQVRLDYRQALAGSGALLGYLIPVQGNVVNPLVMALGLRTRRWWLVGVGAVGQVLIFSVTGYKLVLLTAPAAVVLWWLLRREGRTPALVLMGGVAAVAWTSVLVDFVRTVGLTQIFVNRLLATPGVLVAAHVEVFDNRPKAHWAYSFLSPFLDYPYDVSPAFLVGRIFSHSAVTSANANLFGDGYANLGYAGVLIEAAFLVLLLWALDSACRGLPMSLVGPALLAPAIALSNISVFTSVLSSGFALALVLAVVAPRPSPSERLDSGHVRSRVSAGPRLLRPGRAGVRRPARRPHRRSTPPR